MDSMNDLAAVIGLHRQLRTAERHVDMLVDDAHKTYGRIDYRVMLLAGGRATWLTSDRVELESKA